LATLATALPATAPALGALAAFFLAVAAFDAWRAGADLADVGVAIPDPLRVTQGQEGPLELLISNRSPRSRRLRLALELPRALESEATELAVEVPGSSTAALDWKIGAPLRGRFPLNTCRYEEKSPWGFWARARSQTLDGAVHVYPDLAEERASLRSLFLTRGPIGLRIDRAIGKGREFEKLREYLPGDSREDVHWKATAKRGELVTKEYQIERTQEVYALVDASRLSGRMHGAHSSLDRNLRAALVLALAASRYNDLFGLATFRSTVETFLRARGGRQQMTATREALYDLTTDWVSPDFQEIATFLRLSLRRRSLLVFLTDLSDPTLGEDFLRGMEILAPHHVVIVCSLKPSGVAPLFEHDAESREAVVEQLAGHLAWARLDLLRRSLRRRNVELHLLEEETLAADVVQRYLSVKRRQLL